MLPRSTHCGSVFILEKAKERMSGAVSAEAGMMMGIFCGIAPFLSSWFGNSPSSYPWGLVIAANGPVVFFGVGGCLVSVLLVSVLP